MEAAPSGPESCRYRGEVVPEASIDKGIGGRRNRPSKLSFRESAGLAIEWKPTWRLHETRGERRPCVVIEPVHAKEQHARKPGDLQGIMAQAGLRSVCKARELIDTHLRASLIGEF